MIFVIFIENKKQEAKTEQRSLSLLHYKYVLRIYRLSITLQMSPKMRSSSPRPLMW